MSRTKKYLLALAAVTAVAAFAFAQSPFCVSPGTAIPDNTPAGVDSDQVVGASFVLTDLNVTIQINHTWPGDLSVTLEKVGGPGPFTIMNRPGTPANTLGCSVDNINATLDDSGGTSVQVVCNASPPGVGPGPYQPAPDGLNANFAGTNINGTWRLHVVDHAGGDTGTIAQWCLVTTPTPVELMDFSIE
jgi:Proprotein convertase P-domain